MTLLSRIARQTLAKRGPDYTDEVRRLLDAGRAVMRRCGTDSRPRVADIVAAAGLSNDGFYRHFASKDALVAAILDDGTERLLSYLAHQMAKEETAEGKVRRWVEGVLAQAADEDDRRHHPRRPVERRRTWVGPRPSPTPRPAPGWPPCSTSRFAELDSADPELDAELVAHAIVGPAQRSPVAAPPADHAETRSPGRVLSWPCLATADARHGPGRRLARRRSPVPTPWRMKSQSSSAGSGSTDPDGRPADGGREGVEHDRLEHHAGDRAVAEPGADAPGGLGVVEHLAEQGDQRGEGQGRLGGMAGEELLGEVHHHRGRGSRSTGSPPAAGAAEPVVLDHEPVDALEGVVLVGDLVPQELGGGADRLLEQGQQQLVLAAEVLVEEPERLAGALDHLLHGEVLAGIPLVHQLEGGVEEALQAVLGPGPGRERATAPPPARAGSPRLQPAGSASAADSLRSSPDVYWSGGNVGISVSEGLMSAGETVALPRTAAPATLV